MNNQNLDQSLFNSEDALVLACMSFQTYQFFEEGKLVLPKGFQLRHTMCGIAGTDKPVGEVFGFIAESEDKIIIAFRGSDSTPDLETDLDLFQVPYPYVKEAGKTHRGITSVYQSIRNSLIAELQNLSEAKQLFITGHSLGANLTILAGPDIVINTKFKNPTLYTFAAGRAGDTDFVSLFDKEVKNSVRIYNVHDFIPTLPQAEYPAPFTEEGLIYRHVKTDYPLSFQYNNIFLNHRMANYFKSLSEKNPDFARKLKQENPGFCPDVEI